MSGILVVTWDGGGNVPPALGIAGALRSRGHDVRVIGHPVQSKQISATGLDFVGYRTARPFTSTQRNTPLDYIATFGDRAMGRDVAEECARKPTDLVVVDCVLYGPIEALAKSGIPFVVLEHFYDGYYVKKWLRSPIRIGLEFKGIRVHRLLDEARARVVATLPELDPGTTPSDTVHHTGPVVIGTHAESEEKVVLVSLSTFNFPGQTRAMQNILDALATLPVRAIVTTGPVIEASDLEASPNVELHEYIPHADVMPHASLVIGHGGHATTMQALAHDLPVIVMPMHPLLDQKMVGQSVQAAGAGLLIKKKAPPSQIADAIRTVLEDDSFRSKAERLGRMIRESHGAHTGADVIERVIEGA